MDPGRSPAPPRRPPRRPRSAYAEPECAVARLSRDVLRSRSLLIGFLRGGELEFQRRNLGLDFRQLRIWCGHHIGREPLPEIGGLLPFVSAARSRPGLARLVRSLPSVVGRSLRFAHLGDAAFALQTCSFQGGELAVELSLPRRRVSR